MDNTTRALSPESRICSPGPVEAFIEVKVCAKNHVSYSLLVFGLLCFVMLSCDNAPGVAHQAGHPRRPVLTACVALAWPAWPRPSQNTGPVS